MPSARWRPRIAPDSNNSAATACERPATVAVADRISIAPDGNVLYQLHRPWPKPDSTRTHLTFEPVAFLRRQFLWRCLSALVPSPYQNLIRYHGVFAK